LQANSNARLSTRHHAEPGKHREPETFAYLKIGAAPTPANLINLLIYTHTPIFGRDLQPTLSVPALEAVAESLATGKPLKDTRRGWGQET